LTIHREGKYYAFIDHLGRFILFTAQVGLAALMTLVGKLL